MLIKSKQAIKNNTIKKSKFLQYNSRGQLNKSANIFGNESDSQNNIQNSVSIGEYEKELQNIRDTSFNEGLAQGESAGYEKGLQSIQPYIDDFSKLIDDIQVQQEEVIAESEKFIIKFALKIVETIMGSAEIVNVIIDEKKLHSIVEEALNQFPESTKYILRVHKDTSEFLEPYKGQIIEKLSRPAALSIIEDPSIKPGECLIESEHGVIDARIDSQMEEIKNLFTKKDDDDSDFNSQT